MVDRVSTEESFLMDVDRVIDWKPFERLLEKQYQKTEAAAGDRAIHRCQCSKCC